MTVLLPPSLPRATTARPTEVHPGLLDAPHQQGAACHPELTHQHLSYTVLLPNIAEVPRHVGLEPDVFPIRRGLLDHEMSVLSANPLPGPSVSPRPAYRLTILPRQTSSGHHNVLCSILFPHCPYFSFFEG